MIIRPEQPGDADTVLVLIDAAFPTPEGGQRAIECDLVEGLRADGDVLADLTLVAERAGEIVGQVTCSRGILAGKPSVGLGPISVAPAHQGKGVGTALMQAALAAAETAGEPIVVLLGDPAYYSRFGFRPAADLGIESPDPSWGIHFMGRPLPAWRPDLAGPFRYAAAFDRL